MTYAILNFKTLNCYVTRRWSLLLLNRKGVWIMEKVIQTLRRIDGEKRIPVLKMEIDYELLTLYDALQSNDKDQIKKSKKKLEQLRSEWILLEV